MPAKKSEVQQSDVPQESFETAPDDLNVQFESQATPENEQQVLPEAGGIAFCELFGLKKDKDGIQHLVRINVTSRGFTAKAALDDLLGTLAYASKTLNLNPFNPFESVPVPAPAKTSQVPPSGPSVDHNEPVYEPIAAVTPAPASQAQAVQLNGTMQIVKLGIVPGADGKIKAQFYGAGHKYPDLNWFGTPEAAVQLLQGTGAWAVKHFQVAIEYTVNFSVQWRNSERLNSKGNPYKDIVGIIP